jgi:hypothetical protein
MAATFWFHLPKTPHPNLPNSSTQTEKCCFSTQAHLDNLHHSHLQADRIVNSGRHTAFESQLRNKRVRFEEVPLRALYPSIKTLTPGCFDTRLLVQTQISPQGNGACSRPPIIEPSFRWRTAEFPAPLNQGDSGYGAIEHNNKASVIAPVIEDK